MVVAEVILPKIISYYISDSCIEKIREKVIGHILIPKEDKIVIEATNDFEVFDALKLIKSKTEKMTLGDQHKYEYEMDISIPDGHLFEFILTDDSVVKCTLISVHNLENSDLSLTFKVN